MGAQSMLDQLLKSGLSMLDNKGAAPGASGLGLGKLGPGVAVGGVQIIAPTFRHYAAQK